MQPQVLVEQAAVSRGSTSGRWLVAWRIQNLGQEPLEILSGRLPHSKFRSEEIELVPGPKLMPNETARLEFAVVCNEPPGAIVENAFLILRVLWLEGPWRILARLRVTMNDKGEPETVTELTSTQRIGFSLKE